MFFEITKLADSRHSSQANMFHQVLSYGTYLLSLFVGIFHLVSEYLKLNLTLIYWPDKVRDFSFNKQHFEGL